MPPVEALKMLVSHVATDGQPGQKGKKLLVVDARKAYLHAAPTRDIYVDLLPELKRFGTAPGSSGVSIARAMHPQDGKRFWRGSSSDMVLYKGWHHHVAFDMAPATCVVSCMEMTSF